MAQSKSERAYAIGSPFLGYALVGAVGTAFQYLTLVVLVSNRLVHPVLASCMGAIGGAVVNYCLNYRFVFRSSQRHRDAFPKFFTVAFAGLVLTWASMSLFVRQLGLNYMVAQVITTACVLALTFSLNSLWSFKSNPA